MVPETVIIHGAQDDDIMYSLLVHGSMSQDMLHSTSHDALRVSGGSGRD